MAVIFGIMLLFLITMLSFRVMYPLTISIFNDLATFYQSESWAYFMVGIFVVVVFVMFIALLSWLMDLYIEIVN